MNAFSWFVLACVAVCAVLGMIGKEGIILRRTIWPFVLYCLVAGTVCFYLIGRVL